jgi:hypothetical protein
VEHILAAVALAVGRRGQYGWNRDQRRAAALYSGVLLLMGLAFGAVFAWVTHTDRLLHRLPPPAVVRAARLRFMFGQAVYTAAFGLSWGVGTTCPGLVWTHGPVLRLRPGVGARCRRARWPTAHRTVSLAGDEPTIAPECIGPAPAANTTLVETGGLEIAAVGGADRKSALACRLWPVVHPSREP